MMSHHLLLVVVVVVAAIAVGSASAEYRFASPKWQRGQVRHDNHGSHDLQRRNFSAPLDHYNPRSGETIELTYVQNIDYYTEGGPIYIFVNDAGRFTTEFLEIGLMHDIAHDTGAALITADNRFFRSNLPTQNASTANLQYLTVEQSINDVSRLIETVKADLPGAHRSRVILWGTGLGASLATWTKQKFPQFVDAVWSSSGTYRHVVHTQDTYVQLSNSIEAIGGAACAGNLSEAFIQMSTLMVRGQSWRLSSAIRSCFDVAWYNTYDVAAYFAGVTQILVDFVNVHHATGIESFCADLAQQDDEEDSPQFEAYARWVSHVFTDEFCLDVSLFSRADEAANVDWEFITDLAWNTKGLDLAYPSPSRPNLFWRCSQLGMFGTTVNSRSLFGNTIAQDLFFRYCSAVFGREYNYTHLAGAVENLNVQFGGNRPAVKHVVYTNGELDPLVNFGVHDVEGVESYVFNIPNHARSADLYSISAADRPELVSVKQNIVQLITEWSS